VNNLIAYMANKKINISLAKILILGITFKENCPDMRNSKVEEIYHQIKKYGCLVELFDKVVSPKSATDMYGTRFANLNDIGRSNIEPCFRNFGFRPANGPNRSDVLPSITRVSRCGTDIGGAPTAAWE
jgi:hypothetical protein